MRPEYYADLFRRYATFVRDHAPEDVQLVASGAHDDDYHWTDVVMARAGDLLDAISLHYYSIPTGIWKHKGAATGFGEDQWASTLQAAARINEYITRHSAIMDKYDPQKRVALFVDEWGTWYDQEPGSHPGFLYQQNSLRDALVAAISLDIFERHADRVRMANIAQMINVLQAMILTRQDKMVLTPTYYVFRMYVPFQGATYLPLKIDTPSYRYGTVVLPAVDATAARDRRGDDSSGARECRPAPRGHGIRAHRRRGRTLRRRPGPHSGCHGRPQYLRAPTRHPRPRRSKARAEATGSSSGYRPSQSLSWPCIELAPPLGGWRYRHSPGVRPHVTDRPRIA